MARASLPPLRVCTGLFLAMAFLLLSGFAPEAASAAPLVYSACPPSPTSDCDFYFSRHKTAVPTFKLPNSPDKKIGTVLREKSSNKAVHVGNSNSSLVCPPPSFNYTGQQFYFSGQDARVTVRSYNQAKKSFFENRCIVMNIYHAQVVLKGQTVNLYPNDTNTELFPESRRCAVFKTGPSPPSAISC